MQEREDHHEQLRRKQPAREGGAPRMRGEELSGPKSLAEHMPKHRQGKREEGGARKRLKEKNNGRERDRKTENESDQVVLRF